MGKFLIKLFIKDYENTSDPIVRERYGKFAGVIGIISNVISSWTSLLSNSQENGIIPCHRANGI